MPHENCCQAQVATLKSEHREDSQNLSKMFNSRKYLLFITRHPAAEYNDDIKVYNMPSQQQQQQTVHVILPYDERSDRGRLQGQCFQKYRGRLQGLINKK